MTEGIDQARITVLPDGRVSRRDAAVYLGRKPKTLAMWSTEGRGPTPIRSGGLVFYLFDDLREFAGVQPLAA